MGVQSALGRPAPSISQYHTAKVNTLLTQINTASTSTYMGDAPLPDKVVTRKDTRRTTKIVVGPRSTNDPPAAYGTAFGGGV